MLALAWKKKEQRILNTRLLQRIMTTVGGFIFTRSNILEAIYMFFSSIAIVQQLLPVFMKA